jgi:hypothetical protein
VLGGGESWPMRPKKIFFIVWFFLHQVSAGLAEWTILLVMQGDNNLSYFMHQNIKIIKQIGSNDLVNIAVQWDEPFKHKTWRYKIGHRKLLDDASLQKDMGINPEIELVDAARWAFTTYPSKKRALILWNHGSGVLDEKQNWNKIRGILYDFSSTKCLTNKGLLRALKTIQQDVLSGETFDLIGMDACLMAMVEIGYQIKDFGKILVASENIQYSPGWHYAAILKHLTENPQQYHEQALAHLIVRSFEKFNQNRNSVYTQSAMDLTMARHLKDNIAAFSAACLASPEQAALSSCINRARIACTEFDDGKFIDLHDFYSHMAEEIARNKKISPELRSRLLTYIQDGKQIIKKFVMGHVKGRGFKQSNGLSIYFPRTKKIHRSYDSTLFAQETSWPLFIATFKPSQTTF